MAWIQVDHPNRVCDALQELLLSRRDADEVIDSALVFVDSPFGALLLPLLPLDAENLPGNFKSIRFDIMAKVLVRVSFISCQSNII